MIRWLAALTILVASCEGVPLSSKEQQVVAVADHGSQIDAFDFGMVTGSATHSFMINPQSASDDDYLLSMTPGAACGDFPMTPATVSGMPEICNGLSMTALPAVISCPNSYPFSITFKPSSPGTQSCKIAIRTKPVGGGGGDGVTTFVVRGTGVGAAAAFSLSPAKLDFGSVPTGVTSGGQAFTLTNTGTAAITISPSGVPAAYTFNPPLAAVTLDPSAAQDYKVTCRPAAGANNASIDFSASGAATQTLVMGCTGVATRLDVTPNPIAFGKLIVGAPPITRDVTLGNSGTATSITITSITLSSATGDVTFATMPGMLSLAPGASVPAFTLRYTPTHEVDFGTIATVKITANNEDLTYPVTGATLNGSIGTNPPSIDFGAVCTGSTAMQDVEIYASGRADVSIGLDPQPTQAPFAAMLTSTLVGGGHNGTANLVASVAPGAGDVGALAGEIVIDTNIPGATTYPLDVTMTGVPVGVAPTPTTLAFGDLLVDSTSAAKRVDLSNCGGTGIDVTSAAIVGDAEAFTIVSPPADMIATHLDNTRSESFLVVMSPRKAGPRTAQLQIQTSAGPQTVALTGNGMKAEVDRETYYACRAGGGAASWPVGLALLTIARRRRPRARARTGECPSSR